MHAERISLQERLREIESRLEAQREIGVRRRSIEEYCRRAAKNIDSFGFEEKRLAVDALGIQVVVDGKQMVLSGVVPTHSAAHTPNRPWLEIGWPIASSSSL